MDSRTGTPTWRVIAHDADLLKQEVQAIRVGEQVGDRPEAASELLQTVTQIGVRLAALLDALAGSYENPGVPEQRSAHIELDQAAAAAEDLGACARRAARALREGT